MRDANGSEAVQKALRFARSRAVRDKRRTVRRRCLTWRRGFAVQLAFRRQHGRFPDEEVDVAPAVIAHLATQIGMGIDGAGNLRLGGPQRAPAPAGHHGPRVAP